ncbi:transposase [Amycolatopsis methanolica 239]|uniref:Transposase n=2 Tax=Amycolatopsis methanolica TaxID=1814 RepID=A0A076MRA5_AMYME|nr:transposase [Amycolatopsis methanolica 239]
MATRRGTTMTTRDARSLSPDALEALRRRAVAAVEAGVSRSEVARLFGVSRKTVGAWVLAYRREGEDAFRPKTRGRRPGEQLALSPAQQAWTIKTIISGTPDQYGLRPRLWSRPAVVELVNREFRILLSPATVGHYLVRWGLIDEPYLQEMMRSRVTATVPRPRGAPATAEEWIPEAEVLWVAWTRPHAPADRRAVSRQNLMSGFRNYFGDVNVLIAMSNRGVVHFRAGLGPFDTPHAEDFLHRLMRQLGRPLNVVVCRWPLQQYEMLQAWPRRHSGRISVRFSL